MRITQILVIAAVAVLCASGALAAGGQVVLKAAAETEREVVADDGTVTLVRSEAARVTPGDEVIYTVFYENSGSDAATDVVITNPVPAHMACNEITEVDQVRITASVDGGQTFDLAANLTVVETDGAERPAELADYTHIRWSFTDSMAPGATGQVAFRAILQ